MKIEFDCWLYKRRYILMNSLVVLSTIEIISISFNMGFQIIPENLVGIIENISYAIVGSYVFYLINLVIPEYFIKKTRNPVIFLKVFYLTNCITRFSEEIIGKYNSSISEKEIESILEGRKEHIQSQDYTFDRKHMYKLINQLNSYISYIDPLLMRYICGIDFVLMHLSMNCSIEGMTFGETYSKYLEKLIRTNEEIKNKYKKEINAVKTTYTFGF